MTASAGFSSGDCAKFGLRQGCRLPVKPNELPLWHFSRLEAGSLFDGNRRLAPHPIFTARQPEVLRRGVAILAASLPPASFLEELGK
jgi:hypothetical protein